MSPIQVGASRGSVEAVLGAPISSEKTDAGTIDTYKFDVGGAGGGDGPWWGLGEGLGGDPRVLILVPLIEAIMIPIEAARRQERIDKQRRKIEITYSRKNILLEYKVVDDPETETLLRERGKLMPKAAKGDADALFRLYEIGGKEPERSKRLRLAAQKGHAEAQFELYMRGGTVKEGWKWLCRPAHAGHAPAQYYTGVNYKWGWDRKSTDPIQAYLWYSLSAANGHFTAKFERDDIAKKMTPAQIAEAERLVAEWKPDPASCGELPVLATDTDVAREDTGAQPSCSAVGGYEAYMKRTGKACRVAPIIHVIWGLDDQVYSQE